MRSCKFIDDVVHTDINNADSAKADTIINSVNTENTMTQVFLDTTIHGFATSDESMVKDVVLVLLLVGIETLVVRKT